MKGHSNSNDRWIGKVDIVCLTYKAIFHYIFSVVAIEVGQGRAQPTTIMHTDFLSRSRSLSFIRSNAQDIGEINYLKAEATCAIN